jgi:uncharacterized membrane protein (DUF485 family)
MATEGKQLGRVMQTKLGSFVEASANIAVGFGINFAANLLVLPLFGYQVTPSHAFGIGIVLTGISLARSYVLRRWFNGLRFGNTERVA